MPHQCTSCDRTFADGSKEMLSGCPECGGTKFQFRPDGFDDESAGSGASGDGDASAGADATRESTSESPPGPSDRRGDTVSRTVGNAAATVRDLVGGSTGPDATRAQPPAASESTPASTESASGSTPGQTAEQDDDIIVAESEPVADEDTAQADARSQLVEPDEMPETEGYDPVADAGTDPSVSGDAGTAETATGPDTTAAAETESTQPAATAADQSTAAPAEPDRSVADEPDAERADRPDLSELRKELNDQFESIRVVEPGQYELNLMELYDREEYIIALQEDGRYSIQVPETWRQADA